MHDWRRWRPRGLIQENMQLCKSAVQRYTRELKSIVVQSKISREDGDRVRVHTTYVRTYVRTEQLALTFTRGAQRVEPAACRAPSAPRGANRRDATVARRTSRRNCRRSMRAAIHAFTFSDTISWLFILISLSAVSSPAGSRTYFPARKYARTRRFR